MKISIRFIALSLMGIVPLTSYAAPGGRSGAAKTSGSKSSTTRSSTARNSASTSSMSSGSMSSGLGAQKSGTRPSMPTSGSGRFSRQNGTASTSTTAKTNASTKPTTGTAAATKGSHLSATQTQNVAKLQSDLGSIQQGSQVTQAQKDALQGSLTAMADGATKPDPALTQQLTTDLSGALSDGKLSKQEQAKLAADLSSVMNSANIPMAEVNQAIADAQAILVASGVSQAEVQTVVNDLKAIGGEAQKNVSAATAKSSMSVPSTGQNTISSKRSGASSGGRFQRRR